MSIQKNTTLSERMKKIGIIQKGDPNLENTCQAYLLPSQKNLAQSVISQLQQTIKHAQQIHVFNKGLGLAAPQIGYNSQLALVIPLGEIPLILLNPRLISQSQKTDNQFEGCWSFFDVRGLVERPLEIEVLFQDLHGKDLRKSFKKGTARLILHELDHLQGILYPSRMKKNQKLLSYNEYTEKNTSWHYAR